jgi:diamine N-acetyltransferase
MLELKPADINDIPFIKEVAFHSWFDTYKTVISQEQMEFMYGEMYSPEALLKQMEFLKHQFLVAWLDGKAIGFASYSEIVEQPIITYKLHKLYLLPECKGQKIGRALLHEVEQKTKSLGAARLILNVNRNNPALHFYQHIGYQIIETIDIPYDRFWLNDYVMEKSFANSVS